MSFDEEPDDDIHGQCYHEIKRLEKELKAAREVADFADKFRKFSAHALPTCYSKSCECWHDALAQSIARYDEARQG
jgi:hypothetical protein